MAEERLNYKLSAQTGNFNNALSGALGNFGKFTGGIVSGQQAMMAFATAAAGAVTGLVALGLETAETADEMLKVADQTGIAIETLSQLRYAASQSDTSMESLQAGFKRLSQNVVDAGRGLETYTVLFKALDVEFKNGDGSLRGLEDVLMDVADKFAIMHNGTTKTGLALKLFGRAGEDLIPFLNKGSEGIKEMNRQAHIFGMTMTEETAVAASELRDRIDDTKTAFKGLSEATGKSVIPMLDLFFVALNELLLRIVEAESRISKLQELLKLLATGLELLQNPFKIWSGLTFTAKDETEDLIDVTKQHTDELKAQADMYEKVIAGVLGGTLAKKKAAAQEKLDLKIAIDATTKILEHKIRVQKFDDEYFKAFADKLQLQGDTIQEVNEKIAVEAQSRWKKMTGDYSEELDEQQEIQAIYQAWQEAAVQGVADAVKSIWGDSTATFEDVWKNSLNVFVDVLASMYIEAKFVGKAIQIEMAIATAGLSLLIGLIASIFGGGRRQSKFEIALEEYKKTLKEFLEETEDALEEFRRSISTTANELARASGSIANSFDLIIDAIVGRTGRLAEIEDLIQAVRDRPVPAHIKRPIKETEDPLKEFLIEEQHDLVNAEIRRKEKELRDLTNEQRQIELDTKNIILENSKILRDAILERYELESELIGDITSLLMSQADFVRSLDDNIQDVQRALLTPEELFEATLGDISTLRQLVQSTTGEAQLAALDELRGTFNELFSQAQRMFAGDELSQWQDFVIDGLEDVKDSGINAYGQMIDIALADLDISKQQLFALRASNDLAADLIILQGELAGATQKSLEILGRLAGASPSEVQSILSTIPIRGGGGGNSTYNISVNIPNIRDLNGLTILEAEDLLKGVFNKAARNVGVSGTTWPMKTAPNA